MYCLFYGGTLFSSRQNWDSPNPVAAGKCAPPPFGPGGGHTRLRERGWGSPNSDERTYTVVLYIQGADDKLGQFLSQDI